MNFRIFFLFAISYNTASYIPFRLRQLQAENPVIQKLKKSDTWSCDEEIKKHTVDPDFAGNKISNLLNRAESLLPDTSENDRYSGMIRKGGDDNDLVYKLFTNLRTSEIENEISMQSFAHKLLPTRVPNILRTYFDDKTNREKDQIWIVMKAVKGETLEKLATSDDWNTNHARDLLLQIKVALDKLHENGFSHRDLHLGNIIVSPDMQVSLIDFGKSRDDVKLFYADDNALAIISKILRSEDLETRKKLSENMFSQLRDMRDHEDTISPPLSEASTTARSSFVSTVSDESTTARSSEVLESPTLSFASIREAPLRKA